MRKSDLSITNRVKLLEIYLKAQWAESTLLAFHSVLRKLYKEPSIGASYHISMNLVKWI